MTTNYKYLTLDSSFRNRREYNLASDFSIPINGSGNKTNVFTSLDPITTSFPYAYFTVSTLYPSTVTSVSVNTYSTIDLPPPGSFIPNYFVSSYLESPWNSASSEIIQISSYTIDNTVSPPNTVMNLFSPLSIAPLAGSTIAIRKTNNSLINATVGALGNTNLSVNLGTNASLVDIYTGNYIFFRAGSANNGIYSIISAYNPTTKLATLKFKIPNIPLVGDLYEIDNFVKDNFQPLLYSGNMVNYNRDVYTVKLEWINVPNQILGTKEGGYLYNYPYFYVYLYNDGNKKSNPYIIFSDNPSSNQSLFLVPTPYFTGNETFFTCIDSRSIMKAEFVLSETLHFSVKMPNGEFMQFAYKDVITPTIPPSTPQTNPLFPIGPTELIQLSALFTLQKTLI